MLELIYTSATRGLKENTSGFCSVAWTEGMPVNLIAPLEQLSAYKALYLPGDSNYEKNPVACAYMLFKFGGRDLSVVSRIACAGLDYTGRSNKIAHHVIIENPDFSTPGFSPVSACMSQDNFYLTWNKQPQLLPQRRLNSLPLAQPPASLWLNLTGDSGWAGVIAELFIKTPDKCVYLEYPQDMTETTLLSLISEVFVLLPAENAISFTFTTYFSTLVPGTTCFLRACPAETPALISARRIASNHIISLVKPSHIPSTQENSEYVKTARTGKTVIENHIVSMPNFSSGPAMAEMKCDTINQNSASEKKNRVVSESELNARRIQAERKDAENKQKEQQKLLYEKARGHAENAAQKRMVMYVAVAAIVVLIAVSIFLFLKTKNNRKEEPVEILVSRSLQYSTSQIEAKESKDTNQAKEDAASPAGKPDTTAKDSSATANDTSKGQTNAVEKTPQATPAKGNAQNSGGTDTPSKNNGTGNASSSTANNASNGQTNAKKPVVQPVSVQDEYKVFYELIGAFAQFSGSASIELPESLKNSKIKQFKLRLTNDKHKEGEICEIKDGVAHLYSLQDIGRDGTPKFTRNSTFYSISFEIKNGKLEIKAGGTPNRDYTPMVSHIISITLEASSNRDIEISVASLKEDYIPCIPYGTIEPGKDKLIYICSPDEEAIKTSFSEEAIKTRFSQETVREKVLLETIEKLFNEETKKTRFSSGIIEKWFSVFMVDIRVLNEINRRNATISEIIKARKEISKAEEGNKKIDDEIAKIIKEKCKHTDGKEPIVAVNDVIKKINELKKDAKNQVPEMKDLKNEIDKVLDKFRKELPNDKRDSYDKLKLDFDDLLTEENKKRQKEIEKLKKDKEDNNSSAEKAKKEIDRLSSALAKLQDGLPDKLKGLCKSKGETTIKSSDIDKEEYKKLLVTRTLRSPNQTGRQRGSNTHE